MKYQKAKRLSATEFKRLTGVKRKTFQLLKVIADKGYQGIAKIHQLSETPIKKKKGKKLTKSEKQYNRKLNQLGA